MAPPQVPAAAAGPGAAAPEGAQSAGLHVLCHCRFHGQFASLACSAPELLPALSLLMPMLLLPSAAWQVPAGLLLASAAALHLLVEGEVRLLLLRQAPRR